MGQSDSHHFNNNCGNPQTLQPLQFLSCRESGQNNVHRCKNRHRIKRALRNSCSFPQICNFPLTCCEDTWRLHLLFPLTLPGLPPIWLGTARAQALFKLAFKVKMLQRHSQVRPICIPRAPLLKFPPESCLQSSHHVVPHTSLLQFLAKQSWLQYKH